MLRRILDRKELKEVSQIFLFNSGDWSRRFLNVTACTKDVQTDRHNTCKYKDRNITSFTFAKPIIPKQSAFVIYLQNKTSQASWNENNNNCFYVQ